MGPGVNKGVENGMPVSINYNREKDILYVHVKSPASVIDFQNTLTQIVHSKEYAPDVNTLWDFRELNFVEMDPESLKEMVAIKKSTPQRKGTKRALLIPNDLAFGMTKMYESMARDLPDHIMIFRSFENAELWLLSDI
jgi:hypothetical protein